MENEIKKKLTLDFIDKLKTAYGYCDGQIGADVTLKSGHVADIAIWSSEYAKKQKSEPEIYVLIVCKSEHVRIEAEEYLEKFEDATLSNMTFYVALNMKEKKVFYLKKEKYSLHNILRVSDIPKAEDISSPAKLAKFVERIEKNSKEDFLRQLSYCHNVIRNNDKLSPEASFDEISKVLFIKMMYESNPANDQELTFTLSEFNKEEAQYMQTHDNSFIDYLFNKVKGAYKDDKVFEDRDVIRIKRESFLEIIKALQNINLYDSDEDVKGVTFESFLGKTFRGELGQFFTPRSIVNYMIHVLDIKEGELVCDPCCGSGGFLISAFDYVQHKIDKDIQGKIDSLLSSDSSDKYDKMKRLQKEFDKSKVGSRYYKLCHDYFFGIDANARMARTAKMNMIMHGDGHVGVYLHDGLINVGGVYDGRFDVVLINPPYGVHVDKRMKYVESDLPSKEEIDHNLKLFGREYQVEVVDKIEANIKHKNSDGTKGQSIISTFEAKDERSEVLFIERCLSLLKPGGRAGIVLPEGILNNKNNEKIRNLVERKAKILNITSIPYDVFQSSGASIKPSLVFLQKYENGKDKKSDYPVSVTRVDDAGISSTGFQTECSQLLETELTVKRWITDGKYRDSAYTKIANRSDFPMWNISSCFEDSRIHYTKDFPVVRLSRVMKVHQHIIDIKPDIRYSRVRVKLYNQGIELRDEVPGSKIGTKRQNVVSTGQFIISKIDGKSGAFGIIPPNLDRAIVTSDFLVFDLNAHIIDSEYLQLVMNTDEFLQVFKNNSSGTTHRQRISYDTLVNTSISLPDLATQKKLVKEITDTKQAIAEMEHVLEKKKENFHHKIFED